MAWRDWIRVSADSLRVEIRVNIMAAPREEVMVEVRVERRCGVSSGRVRCGGLEASWGVVRERSGGTSGYLGG